MASSVPPNVFLLAIDSLRADVIARSDVPTPNMDAFADAGTTFRQCIATSTTTTPSFASMLTGCYPPKHGVRGLQGYKLAPSVTTMPEAFGRAGYNTYAEVTGPLLPETGVLRGFADVRHRPGYRQPFFGWRERVLEALAGYAAPWFMLLHIWEVHRPFRAPPDFEKRTDRAGYEAAVTATDEWLQPIFDALPDNTIVVITGDHGEEYPESRFERLKVSASYKARRTLKLRKWFPYLDSKLGRFAVGHGFGLYEELVRVPLIVAGPGVAHAVVDDQVRHIDLFPTVADLAGVRVPDGIDGRSLKPLLERRDLPDEPAYMEAVGVILEGRRICGARTSDWKLLRHPGGRLALYRLDGGAAPNEKRNLASRYPELVRRLEAFIDRVNATEAVAGSGMTDDEEALVEQHLRDLGYL